jgi:protein gp37
VENRKYGLPRLHDLQVAPVKVRFLSVEPLLEHLGDINLDGISWVIVGGESGHGARPMREEWVVSILEQCRAAGVPFFFKQWGGINKARTGRLLLGETYDEYPDVVRSEFPARRPREQKLESVARALCHVLRPGSQGAVNSSTGQPSLFGDNF